MFNNHILLVEALAKKEKNMMKSVYPKRVINYANNMTWA